MSKIDAKLETLGITLPTPMVAVANYVPFIKDGSTTYISGQVSIENGEATTGKVGADLTVEEGAQAARVCGLNLIAQMKAAADGDLDRVTVLKLVGFVNSTADFTDQPKVINGASDLMVEVFGDKGRHARSAVSAGALPLGVAVEVEAIIRID